MLQLLDFLHLGVGFELNGERVHNFLYFFFKSSIQLDHTWDIWGSPGNSPWHKPYCSSFKTVSLTQKTIRLHVSGY